MTLVPRDASEEQILALVRAWVEALAREDYDAVFNELGYALAFGRPGAQCIRDAIQSYRSAAYYPGVEEFAVTDWRTADGGNPDRMQEIVWYKPNESGLVGAVAFDLPLNGRWSDLTANFVFCEGKNPETGYPLGLEDIQSMPAESPSEA
jgi:hypothetical protein